MDHFSYKNGTLHAEAVPVDAIAAEHGTPTYIYSNATLTRHFQVFDGAFSDLDHAICYAVKANDNHEILKRLGALGAGADCVSAGEIMRSIKAGIDPSNIVFSGVGKQPWEIEYGIKQNIMQFNVESEPELELLSSIAASLGATAKIAFRVNPDVDAGTHDKIATGRQGDKFGIAYDDALRLYNKAATLDGIEVQSVAVHIGSQLTNLEPFRQAFTKIKDLVIQLREAGHNITHLDLGGGLGIPYKKDIPPSPSAYGQMVKEVLGDIGCKLVFEPGRLIVGNAGILLSKVIFLKETYHGRKFLIIDAAMNDLIRPTLYDAYHDIVPSVEFDHTTDVFPTDIVGPVCETGDVFGKDRELPTMKADDLIAIRSCGAYGSVMACSYNTRPLPAEVLVDGDEVIVLRKRQSLDELLAR